MSTKMVLCIRRDLKMRRGKEISQGSHAAMSFLTRNLNHEGSSVGKQIFSVALSEDEIEWIKNSFTKVTCQVKNEEELLGVVEKAKAAGLTVHLVTDAGKTEFSGVLTHTCCAIGPNHVDKFVGITDHLELY